MQVHDAIGDWSSRPGPLFRRLAGALREAIERADLPPGSALPPERALAKRLAVGRGTVVAAYELLRRDVLVTPR
jgi:DNA-binding GntR family transcriptional regulator